MVAVLILSTLNCLRIIPIPKRISTWSLDTLTVRESNNIAHANTIAELASNGMDLSVLRKATINPDPAVIIEIARSNLRVSTPV
tara:strand:- start:419 stop:670 length:252 start_codon:yes stop_codon:yes gene_type:complete